MTSTPAPARLLRAARLRSHALAALALACALTACGDDAAETDDASTNGGTTSTSSGTTSTNSGTTSTNSGTTSTNGGTTSTSSGTTSSQNPPPRADSCADIHAWVAFYNGSIQDGDGQPVPSAKAQLCARNSVGTLVCLRPADTDATGAFTILSPDTTMCLQSATMRALLPSTHHSTAYCHIDLSAEGIVNIDQPVILHATTPATTLPPEGDRDQPRDVVFADGLTLSGLIPSQLYTSGLGYDGLAATRLDPASAPGLCFLDDVPTPPEAIYAFSPEGDFTEGVPFSFPNSTGLAPNTSVDLFVLGGLDCSVDGELIEEAEWHKFGTGTVSQDGATIASDPGSPLPCLTWFGYSTN